LHRITGVLLNINTNLIQNEIVTQYISDNGKHEIGHTWKRIGIISTFAECRKE